LVSNSIFLNQNQINAEKYQKNICKPQNQTVSLLLELGSTESPIDRLSACICIWVQCCVANQKEYLLGEKAMRTRPSPQAHIWERHRNYSSFRLQSPSPSPFSVARSGFSMCGRESRGARTAHRVLYTRSARRTMPLAEEPSPLCSSAARFRRLGSLGCKWGRRSCCLCAWYSLRWHGRRGSGPAR
jgi:hypothetical protein